MFAQTKNHWSTLQTNLSLIENGILPAAKRSKEARRRAGQRVSDKVLILLDYWPVQKSPEFREKVKEAFPTVILQYVPPNLTGVYQPLDVAVNGVFKKYLRDIFGEWAVEDVQRQLQSGVPLADVELSTDMKERKKLLPKWVKAAWDRVSREEVISGWEKAGLLKAWDPEVQSAAVQRMLRGELFPVVAGTSAVDTQPVPEGEDDAEGAHALEGNEAVFENEGQA